MVRAKVKVTGPVLTGKASSQLKEVSAKHLEQLYQKGNNRIGQIARIRPGGVFKTRQAAGRHAVSQGNYSRSRVVEKQ